MRNLERRTYKRLSSPVLLLINLPFVELALQNAVAPMQQSVACVSGRAEAVGIVCSVACRSLLWHCGAVALSSSSQSGRCQNDDGYKVLDIHCGCKVSEIC